MIYTAGVSNAMRLARPWVKGGGDGPFSSFRVLLWCFVAAPALSLGLFPLKGVMVNETFRLQQSTIIFPKLRTVLMSISFFFPAVFLVTQGPNVCSCLTWTLKKFIEMADAPRLQLNPVQFHTAWSTGGAIVDYFIIKAWKVECICKRDFINLLLAVGAESSVLTWILVHRIYITIWYYNQVVAFQICFYVCKSQISQCW